MARQGVSTDDLWSVGSLRSDESLQVASEVPGRIAEILFKEGEDVKAGDVLVKLDDALVRAEVEDAKARLTLAQSNYDRAQSLSKSGSGTERTLDESTSALETAKAAVQLAETKLSKLSLTAPFPGRVGLRTMSVGAYATPGTPIVNLEKIDQLKLDFRVPETVLTQVSVDQDVELRVDALPGRTFPGKIYAIDPQVDVNGRALRIRARVANPDLSLLPGLFARVIIKGLEERPVVRVAESAIVSRGQDKIVYLHRRRQGEGEQGPARTAGAPARSRSSKGWRRAPRSSPPGRPTCATERRSRSYRARSRAPEKTEDPGPWDCPKSAFAGPSSPRC